MISKGAARAWPSLADEFTGKPLDAETGLDYFGFRYNSSTLGRWMTPDPAGNLVASPVDPQSWNQYAYVMNNPTTWTDPNGLWCVWDDGTHDDPPSDGNGAAGPLECVQQGGTWLDPVQTMATVRPDGSSSVVTTGGGTGQDSASGGGSVNQTSVVAEIRQFFRQAVCGVFSPLVNAANPQNLDATVGVGVGGSAGAGFILGIAASAGVQVVADRSGNLGVAFNVGGNPGYGVFGVGALAGGQALASNARSIYDLSGSSVDFGGSIGAGPAVGGDISVSGENVTTILTVGPGIGTKGAAFGADYTFVPSLLSTNCRQ